MPSLAELTDREPQPALSEFNTNVGTRVDDILNKLTGANGQQRYQLWPEKVIRGGLTAAGDVMQEGTINPGLRREDFTDIPAPDMPTKDSTALGKLLNVAPVAASPQDKLIGQAQEISALAGTGGLAGADATLGSTAFLRPALKYKDKIYKGKEGQQHQDVIPKELYPEFEQMAMNGEDLSHYNFGFMNHKGQFLDREKALKYAIDEGLLGEHTANYGALTSTLMADSSKPGTAIEAMGKALEKQRSLEGYRAAIKDPETGKVYDNGRWHPEIISNIEDQAIKNRIIDAFVNKSDKNSGYFNVAGYLNKSNKFFNRNEMENGIKDSSDLPINKSKTAQFRSDSSKPGVAIEAMGKILPVQEFVKNSVIKDRLYHGSHSDFSNNFKGKYFSDDPKVSSRFAELGAKTFEDGGAANITPAYLDIRNPLIIDAAGDYAANFQFGKKGEAFRKAMEDNSKYDGVILKNTKDEGNVHIVKNSSQVRGALK